MFWKNKKQRLTQEPKIDETAWLRVLLSDYNLLDVNGLLAIMKISLEKSEKELAKEVLNYFQPKILEEIKKGGSTVRIFNVSNDELLKIFPSYNYNTQCNLNDKLRNFGYLFGVNRLPSTDAEIMYTISFELFKPISREK